MTFSEAKSRARNPGAFNPSERWIVVNTVTGEPLQTDASQARAVQSAQWCNDHEIRCGRAAVYAVEELS